MAVRTLIDPMRAYRIGDPNGKYPIYSGEGAALNEGRWHNKGQEVIYASLHYSTSMLEKLVHYNGILPPNQHFIEIDIPVGASYEVVTKDSLPSWEVTGSPQARGHGAQWLVEKRTLILLVPSVVAREEQNVLINPHHPEFFRIKPSLERPIWWDPRLSRRE
jgi:RES domain-containing protein